MPAATAVFNRISANNLRGDLFGGLTAAVIALPKARAIGRAITAAVRPPNRSPRRLLALIRLNTAVAAGIKNVGLARNPKRLTKKN